MQSYYTAYSGIMQEKFLPDLKRRAKSKEMENCTKKVFGQAFYKGTPPVGGEIFTGDASFCFHTPCPLSLREGEGVPPRHPVVHRSANDRPLPSRGGVFRLLENNFEVGECMLLCRTSKRHPFSYSQR